MFIFRDFLTRSINRLIARAFVRSFVHSFASSLVRCHVCSLPRLFDRLPVRFFVHPFLLSLVRSLIRSFAHSFVRSFVRLLFRSFIRCCVYLHRSFTIKCVLSNFLSLSRRKNSQTCSDHLSNQSLQWFLRFTVNSWRNKLCI